MSHIPSEVVESSDVPTPATSPRVHSSQRFRLRQALRHASSGVSTLVWLKGPTGIGKTYLARELLRDAEKRGFRAVYVTGEMLRNTPAPVVLLDLLEQLDWTDDGGWASLARAGRLALQEVARDQPLAVVIDAVDLLVGEEVALVEGLLRRPPVGPLLVVMVTQSRRSAPTRARQLDNLAVQGCSQWIEVGPLTPAETGALLEAWFEPEVLSPEFVDEAFELTAGNPYHLSLLRLGVERLSPADRRLAIGGAGEVPVLSLLPEHVLHHAVGIIRELPPDAALCLHALAAWGAPAPLDVLVPLCDIDEWRVVEAVEMLEAQDLAYARVDVELGTTVHLVDWSLGRLVDQGMGVARGRLMHRRAAELMEREGIGSSGAEVALAMHYVRGGASPTRDTAERILNAGATLVQRGRYRRARACIEFVLSSLLEDADNELWARAMALAGRVYVRLGDRGRVESLLAAAADTSMRLPPEERSQLVRWLARRLVDAGQDERALALCVDELEHADLLSPAERAALESDAAKIAYQTGRIGLARSLVDRSVERAHGALFHELESTSLVSLGSIDWRSGRPGEALATGRRAIGAAQASHVSRAYARAGALVGLAHIDLGDPARGRRWLHRSYRSASAAGDRSAQSICARSLTYVEVELGDWEGAAYWARQTVAIDDGVFRSRHARRTRALLMEILARRGVFPSALDLPRVTPDLVAGTPPDVVLSEVLALSAVEEARGNQDRARQLLHDLEEALSGVESAKRDIWVEVLPRSGLLAFFQYDADALAGIADRMESASRAQPRFTIVALEAQHMRGLSRALDGDGDGAARLVAPVAEAFSARGFRWRASRAQLTTGLLLSPLQAKLAAAALREAYRGFEEMGAVRELELTRVALDRIGKRPPSRRIMSEPHILTDRELQIASLAANGLTNPEIAYRLEISPRTVATHVHRILGKTGLQSRIQLSEWLAREGRAS